MRKYSHSKAKGTVAALLAMVMLLMLGASALAQEPQTITDASNALSVSQIARWAEVIVPDEPEEGEEPGEEPEIPEGATRVSIQWNPDDQSYEEDSVVAVIAGSGIPEKVLLERSAGWSALVKLTPSNIPPVITLVGVKLPYIVERDEQTIVFAVTLPAAAEEEVEEEPTEVPTEEPTAEPTEEPEVPTEDDLRVEVGVSYIMAEDTLYYGDTAVFTGYLYGYDGFEYVLNWQVDRGNGWEEIEGANSDTYSVVLTPENASYLYRLEATIILPEPALEASE